jgi:hypothetical protein
LAVAVALSGCGATTAGETPPAAIARIAAFEAEADGLPPQVAPPVHRAREPDDPREPFSRNYGPRRTFGTVATFAAMSDAEAEAVIARAIAEHEMRRP